MAGTSNSRTASTADQKQSNTLQNLRTNEALVSTQISGLTPQINLDMAPGLMHNHQSQSAFTGAVSGLPWNRPQQNPDEHCIPQQSESLAINGVKCETGFQDQDLENAQLAGGPSTGLFNLGTNVQYSLPPQWGGGGKDEVGQARLNGALEAISDQQFLNWSFDGSGIAFPMQTAISNWPLLNNAAGGRWNSPGILSEQSDADGSMTFSTDFDPDSPVTTAPNLYPPELGNATNANPNPSLDSPFAFQNNKQAPMAELGGIVFGQAPHIFNQRPQHNRGLSLFGSAFSTFQPRRIPLAAGSGNGLKFPTQGAGLAQNSNGTILRPGPRPYPQFGPFDYIAGNTSPAIMSTAFGPSGSGDDTGATDESGTGSFQSPPPRNTTFRPQGVLSTDARRTAQDRVLLEGKAAGLTYKEIKQKMGTTVAESTLRGRYRSLTKPRHERIRKPVWKNTDIALLNRIVGRELERLNKTSGRSASLDQKLTKISWKKVAEYIVSHGGSYHFGNSTCKKKWVELHEHRSTDSSG